MYAEKIVFPQVMDYSPRYHQLHTSPSGAESLHNFADLNRHPLRKSVAKSAICKLQLQIFPGIAKSKRATN